jgi:hypothetical protein
MIKNPSYKIPFILVNKELFEYNFGEFICIEKIISSINSFLYDDKKVQLRYDNCCVICLNNFEKNNSISCLNCNHCFHKDCLEKWLFVKLFCPLCFSIVKYNKNKELLSI